MTHLSYAKLRAILALTVTNPTLSFTLEKLFSGATISISETDLIRLIIEAEVDKDVIRILSDADPDAMDAIEALRWISDFFGYIRANKQQFQRWLADITSPSAKNPPTSPGNPAQTGIQPARSRNSK